MAELLQREYCMGGSYEKKITSYQEAVPPWCSIKMTILLQETRKII